MQAIVLVDDDWGIAKDGVQVIMIPEDLKHFKELTDGHPVIMGRKTYECLPSRKPLSNRRNIIISQSLSVPHARPEGFEVYPDVTQVLLHTLDCDDDIFVIGGEKVYEAFLPFCETVYVTHVHAFVGADRFFPVKLNCFPDMWKCDKRSELYCTPGFKNSHGLKYEFLEYRRCNSSWRNMGSL